MVNRAGSGWRRSVRVLGCVVLLGSVAVADGITPAGAGFPGRNGRIFCQSNRDGNGEVYAFNPSGSSPRRLTDNPATELEATPSPDGTRVAFTSTRDGDQEIYVMYQDGSGVKRLTFSPGEDRPGTWSPDGTQIAFHSGRFPAPPGPGHSSLEIMKMNADGSNQTRLTNNNFQDSFAHWSPLGDKIAFTTNRDGDFEIYTMSTDGSNQTRITNSPGEDAHASWSPDGTQLTFHSRRDFPTPTGVQLEIYRMNADGSNPVRLTGVDQVFDVFPSWSPDGSKIVWAREFPEDVYTMNAADGSGKAKVTNTPGASDSRCDWARLLPCTISGSGNIVGTPGDDVICGSPGNDHIDAGAGNDVVYPNNGNDVVAGGPGDDIVFGRRGADRISGDAGHDTLFGDQGNDELLGGPGNDIISGGENSDRVVGGAGADECYGEVLAGCP